MAALAESIAAKVIALTIIVIVIVSVAIPVIQDAQDTQVSEFQNTTQRYLSASVNESLTVGWDADKYPTFNGQRMDITYDSQFTVWLAVITDNVIISLVPGTSMLVYDVKNMVYATIGAETETVITFDNGTYSWNKSGTDYTGSYSFLFYPSKDGTWGMFGGAAGNLCVTNGTTIYGYYATTGHVRMVSSITDGVATNVMAATTVSDSAMVNYDGVVSPVVTSTEAESGTYSTYSGKYTETPTGGTASDYSMGFIAPIKYIDVSDEDSMMRSLIGIIPILLIICAVMFAVRMLNGSRN